MKTTGPQLGQAGWSWDQEEGGDTWVLHCCLHSFTVDLRFRMAVFTPVKWGNHCFTSQDSVRPKHDNASELALKSISKACKHKGLQDEVPLAGWCCEAVCTAQDPTWIGDCGIHCMWQLNLLRVPNDEEEGWGWPFPFMAVWELETRKPIILKKLFRVLQKLLSPLIYASQVHS